MNLWQRTLYWGVTGALLGFGLIGIMTIGLPLLAIGAVMFLYGVVRVGGTGSWGGLIGYGTLPALFLLPRYLFTQQCAPGTVLSLPADAPLGTIVSCGQVDEAFLDMGLAFVAIAIIGLIWGIVAMNRRHTTAV